MAFVPSVESSVAAGTQQTDTAREVRQTEQTTRESAEQSSAAAKQAVEENPNIVVGNRNIEFAYNEEADRVVVTVRSEDDEIIRQIPPEDYISFVSRFRELIGVGLDEVA